MFQIEELKKPACDFKDPTVTMILASYFFSLNDLLLSEKTRKNARGFHGTSIGFMNEQ